MICVDPVLWVYLVFAAGVVLGVALGIFFVLAVQEHKRNRINRLHREERGNIITMLFAATAMVGVLGVAGMQTVMGPVTTITKVTQKNMVDSDLMTNARIVVMNAGTLPDNGDGDGDNYVEPAPYRTVSCAKSPNGGGCLPLDIGAVQSDPWGTPYGYCVWDHGPAGKNSSAGRLNGEDNTSQPVIAIISAGADKTFQTSCHAFDGGATEGLAEMTGSDDSVRIYTYDAAVAGSGGLWVVKPDDANTAIIDKKLEVGDVAGGTGFAFDTTTGQGEFPYIKTDFLASKSGTPTPVTMENNLALGGNWLSGDGGNEGVYIDASGSVGVGIETLGAGLLDGQSPRYLHVGNEAGQSVLALSNSSTDSMSAMGSITFGTTGGTAIDKRSAVILSTLTSDSSAAVSAKLGFYTNNNGTIAPPKMVILPSGNIGIGTDEPEYKITVVESTDNATTIGITNTNGTAPNARSILFLQGNGGGQNSGGLMYANSAFNIGSSYDAIRPDALTLYTNPQAAGGISFISGAANAPITFNTGGYNAAKERIRITADGNIGIGTSAPTNKLQVQKDSTDPVYINVINEGGGNAGLWAHVSEPGARALTYYRTVASGGTPHYWHIVSDGADDNKFKIGQTTVFGNPNLTILKNGNVGIGTSDPTQLLTVGSGTAAPYSGPTDKVAVIAGPGENAVIQVTAPTDRQAGIFFSDPDSRQSGGMLYEHAYDRLRLLAGGTGRLHILSDGKVGIGTAVPTELLQVNGNVDVTNSRILRVATPTVGTDAANKDYVDSLGGRICTNGQVLKWQDGVWNCAGDQSGGGADNLGGGGTTTGALYSKNASGYGYIGQDGNNYFRFDAGAGANRILTRVGGEWVLLNDTSTFRPYANNTLDLGTSGARWKSGWFTGDVSSGSNTVSGPIYNDHSSATYDVWIQGGAASATGDARNLAILGVISGDYLSINHSSEYTGGTRIGGPVNIIGDTAISGAITSSAGTIRDSGGGWVRTYGNTGWYSQTHGGGWFMSDTTWIRAYSNKSVVTGGNMQAAAFLYGSDERLKADIRPLNLSLDDLDRIGTYRYHYKTDVDKTPRLGVIAQEVQSVFPEAVQTGEDGMMSVDYPSLVPVLFEAVKQLKAENDAIRRQMKADNDNLRMEIRALTKEAR